MNLAKLTLSVLMVLCQIQSALATNLWFMPGDACFPVVLDKNLAEKLRDSKHKMHLEFSSLSGGGAFCGYAGYNSIDIEDVPVVWSENILDIYMTLRADMPRIIEQELGADGKVKREIETNGFLMFVQNGSFDVQNFQVGFRYNEDWMNTFPGPASRANLYQPYFTHTSDIIEDWGNSKHVESLKVQFPKPDKTARTEFEKQFGKGPITGSANELKLVILPQENLADHILRRSSRQDFSEPAVASRKENGPMIVLDKKGVWLFRRDKERNYRAIPWNRTLKVHQMHKD